MGSFYLPLTACQKHQSYEKLNVFNNRERGGGNTSVRDQIVGEFAVIAEFKEDEAANVDRLVNEILALAAKSPGYTTMTEYSIGVQGAPPVKHKQRRMLKLIWEVAEAEVGRMLAADLIERSPSAGSSSPVIDST